MEAKPSEFFALARFLFQYALNRRYDGLVLAIHPRQLRFYQRICPIVPLGAPYRQAKLANSLAVACRIDLDASSLMRVMPGILSWFETPISLVELNRPGISLVDNSFLTRYADNDDHASPSIGAAGVALAS